MATTKSCQGMHHLSTIKTTAGRHVSLMQAHEDGQWNQMPPQARGFIFKSMDASGFIVLNELLDFWISPEMIQCMHNGRALKLCIASWTLALIYLEQNAIRMGRALMINGAFLHQCFNSGIERIDDLYKSGTSTEAMEEEMPYFVAGIKTSNSLFGPTVMKKYILRYLPTEYARTVNRNSSNSSSGMMGYVNQISGNWNGSTKGSHKKVSQKQITTGGSPIQLIFNDANQGERHSFDINSSTSLKALFNNYAEKRGISLRSLRFSHDNSVLFLSSAGKRTPEELGMHDKDIIEVHGANPLEETLLGKKLPASKKRQTKKKARPKEKTRVKSKRSKQEDSARAKKAKEEFKIEHSKALGKVHDEMQPRLKQIRQHLNNLAIKCSQPKKKSKHNNPKNVTTTPSHSMSYQPSTVGLGGKAGRSMFIVQVGEVENLHKTSKPSACIMRGSHEGMPKLDLHGRTSSEALMMLDGNLKAWVDAAMRGEYPFVMQVVIICGCGNQILSETVQEWIKSKSNVCNTPKKG